MSLYEKADGILDTHVTWQDVEGGIQKSLGTKARIGEEKKITNISDMKGFMSRIALVEVDWVGAEEGVELPKKFIVKISSQIPLIALSKMMKFEGENGFSDEKMDKLARITRECHNREVEAYKILMKFNHPDIPYTKVYALKSFADEHDLKGFMVADFVPNVHTVGMHKSIPADDLVSLIKGIATFAALGTTLPEEEIKFVGGPDYLDLMFSDFFDQTTLENSFKGLRGGFSEDYHDRVERVIEIFWQYRDLSKKYSKIPELLGHKLVLNHGDLWQSNMLHSLDKDGKMKLEAMIDWQGLSRMPPGLDISRLFFGCLSSDDRHERGIELLKFYHDTFNSVLGKELFSFEELLGSYNLFLPMAAMIILPGALNFFDQAPIPEEEKPEARKTLMQNMKGMLEDVLKSHEYNLKHFPEFMKYDL